MKNKIKDILGNSFYQLIVLYAILVFIISLGLFSKYTYHFEIAALIIAVIGGISIISKDEIIYNNRRNKYFYYALIGLGIVLIIGFRIIPYIGNSIPIGYDSGIYKYAIEADIFHLDSWMITGITMEPLFLYLMIPFKLMFSSQFILTYLLIGLCALLGIGIYFVTKEFFGSRTGLIALLIYSVSAVQFLTFSYMYYRNIIGLCFALFSIYFLKRSERTHGKIDLSLFILLGGLIGAIHRPTFYIFGLSYFVYAFISPFYNNYKKYDLKILGRNVIYGIFMLVIAGLFYIGQFRPAILNALPWVAEGFIQPGESPGTFINFFTYQFSTLAYLLFAILGVFYLARKKEFNMITLWAVITGGIVYFQFFFFNRFIIHLDIALIILAAVGFNVVIENKKKVGMIVLVLMLVSAGIMTYNMVKDTRHLIGENELSTIEYLGNTENNSFVMATSSIYSPWVLGYSGRKTIAPGLFDYSIHNEEEWQVFWSSSDIEEIKSFMNVYDKPLYLFIGEKQKDNLAGFPECFTLFYEKLNNKIYKYNC